MVAPIETAKPAVIDDEGEGSETRHPDVYARYAAWRAMPSLLRRPPKNKDGSVPTPEDFAASLGIDDPDAMELLGITTQVAFAEKFGVHDRTLTRWNKTIKNRDVFADMRDFAIPLHKNVMLSLYNKTIRGGLPEHYALWFKVFAQWSEKMQIDLTKRTVRTIRYEIVDQRTVPVEATVIDPTPAPAIEQATTPA